MVILENFTWDWIYQAYEKEDSGFRKIISSLHKIYSEVDFHIQCEPYCRPLSSAQKVDPIFRAISECPLKTKRILGIDNNEEFALLTTGGITMQHLAPKNSEMILVIPGNHDRVKREGQIIFIPMKVNIPFTSLVDAASFVIGKAGYGTVAECWGTQTLF